MWVALFIGCGSDWNNNEEEGGNSFTGDVLVLFAAAVTKTLTEQLG